MAEFMKHVFPRLLSPVSPRSLRVVDMVRLSLSWSLELLAKDPISSVADKQKKV